ncbi:hypothetical protein FIBSPDRAFT_1043542 [Athelia psychrophila]|nr:hypothetical protein FIBSPDRAFT_1043542 [Fibularhizoctonia sp. CBS 109695]
MFFKVSTITASTLFAVLLLAGPVAATVVGANPVLACNGPSDPEPGTPCIYQQPNGSLVSGTCEFTAGPVTCIAN